LRLALRGARRCGRAAYDDAYEEVDVADAAARFGTLEAARLVFEASARAQQPVLTSVRSRELLCAAAQLGAGRGHETCLRRARESESAASVCLLGAPQLATPQPPWAMAAPSLWLCAALRTPGGTITLGRSGVVRRAAQWGRKEGLQAVP
jgi:hypothetical protein